MKILVIGSKGRMGKLMCEVGGNCGHEVLGIDQGDREKAIGFIPDVIVDFSSWQALKENLELAKKKSAPIIVATTGHSDENVGLIKKYSKQIAVFVGSNLSILFNILLKIANNIKIPSNSDVILEETHHKNKKDSPSGSAKELLSVLSYDKERVKVISNRVGEVVGVHKLDIYLGQERLEITHTAENRKVFCEGAIRVCEFLVGKKPGLYTMQDLLK